MSISNTLRSVTPWQAIITAVVLIFICWVAWPARFYFLNDDFIHIPLAGQGKLGHRNSIRHIGDFSLFLDYTLFQRNAVGYHITNLVIHLANILLAFVVLCKSAKLLGSQLPAFVAIFMALLFGIFGFHSDAVFWVIGRSASLGLFFFLLSCIAYMQSLSQKGWLIILFATWSCALFSYESVWVFTLLTWLFVLWQHRQLNPGNKPFIWQSTLLVTFCWLVYLVLRKYTTGEMLGTYEAEKLMAFDLPDLCLNFFKLFGRTMLPPMANPAWFVIATCFVYLFYLSGAAFLIRRERVNAFWWMLHAAWLLSYLPYLSLGISTQGIESERYLYLPSFFASASILLTFYLLFSKYQPIMLVIMASLFMYHGWWFYRAGSIYTSAGNTVNQTFQLMSNASPNAILYITELPNTIDGVPVLRLGFEEGIRWLLPGHNFHEIKIISTRHYKRMSVIPNLNASADTLSWQSIPHLR